MHRTPQRHLSRQRADAVDVLRICLSEATAQEVTDVFFFGSALYSPHPNNFDLIVLGAPSTRDARTRLETAMSAKTGWTIDVHCLESDSPWLQRLDSDRAGMWLLKGGRLTTTAADILEGKLAPTYVGRLGLRHFVRLLVSNLKVFALFLHKRSAITFPDLYDSSQRLWKLYLDFKQVTYDSCSRDKVVDKLEEVLSTDLSDLRVLARHCRDHIAANNGGRARADSGSLPPVGETIYHTVNEIVKHTIHSAGLRDAVLEVVGEIEAARADSIDSIRVSEEILRRLPKRPYDDSEQPYGLGRPNVNSLKSDGRGVLLENARPAVGKRPRSSGQPVRAEAATTATAAAAGNQTMQIDVDVSVARPSKRSRGGRGRGRGDANVGAENGGGEPRRTPREGRRGASRQRGRSNGGGEGGSDGGGQPVHDLDTGLQSVRTAGRPASGSPRDRRRR